MTQITISQWLSSQSTSNTGDFMTTTQPPLPRYQIVSSKKFYGHFDVLDTHTGERQPCANLRTARVVLARLNK